MYAIISRKLMFLTPNTHKIKILGVYKMDDSKYRTLQQLVTLKIQLLLKYFLNKNRFNPFLAIFFHFMPPETGTYVFSGYKMETVVRNGLLKTLTAYLNQRKKLKPSLNFQQLLKQLFYRISRGQLLLYYCYKSVMYREICDQVQEIIMCFQTL